MSRWIEFLEDDTNSLSMARLLHLLSWLVTSVIMIWLQYVSKMSEGYLTIYIGAFTASFIMGKQSETRVTLASTKNE